MSSPAAVRSSSAPAPRSWSKRPSWWVVLLAGVGLAFLALPVLALLLRAVESGALTSALAGRAVLDALVLSLSSTAVSLIVVVAFGTPLAFVLARTSFRASGTLRGVVRMGEPASRPYDTAAVRSDASIWSTKRCSSAVPCRVSAFR